MLTLILAGGLGTRLRTLVDDRPKCMAEVAGRPFLEYLLLAWKQQGWSDFVVSTGYRAEVIEDYFGDGHQLGVTIAYSRETEALGTAGAMRLAADKLGGPRFAAANGDSLLEVNLSALAACHQAAGGIATIALTRVPDASRYGTVELDPNGRIDRFVEKAGAARAGVINGGVYILDRAVLDRIPPGKVSFEQATLPGLLEKGVYGMMTQGYFIDIGTPEDLGRVRTDPSELLRSALNRAGRPGIGGRS